jgi:hypothetical protein
LSHGSTSLSIVHNPDRLDQFWPAGTLVVAEGELVEVIPLGAHNAVERTLEPGRPRHVAVGTVHDVVDRGPAPATSIHVYSPPLTTMTYYDATSLAPVERVAR